MKSKIFAFLLPAACVGVLAVTLSAAAEAGPMQGAYGSASVSTATPSQQYAEYRPRQATRLPAPPAPQYSITMSATDPQGDQLRYGIDWNADGSVDEWVPASGYVPSGTQESASRTFAVAGTKTVKVLAQDASGLSSGWATLSFSCADATNSAVGNFNDNGNVNQNAGSGSVTPDLTITAVPSLVRSGDTTKVNWSATNVQSCTVTAPNGDAWNAVQSIIGGETSKPITAATTYTLTCLDLQGATQPKPPPCKSSPPSKSSSAPRVLSW